MKLSPLSLTVHLLVCLVMSPVLIFSANPGAKIRISQSGLDYGANLAVKILSDSVDKLTIPDIEGSASFVGKVEYKISNMKVTNFRQPSTSVTLNTGSSLTWSVSNAHISLQGNWAYKLKLLIPIRDSGSFTGDVSGVSVSLSVNLGVDAAGRPTISYSDCRAQVQDIRIKLSGGASWLYNLFISFVEKPVKRELEKLICKEAQKVIDSSAAKELASFPIQVAIGNEWMLDYRLVQSPVSAVSYLEAGLKGKIHSRDDASDPPFEADILPNPSSSDKMVTIWLSDYMLNSAGYALHNSGILQHTFTAKDLPPGSEGYLDTTCSTTVTCVGDIIPPIAERYPNASVEVAMSVTSAPRAVINQTGIHGTFVGEIAFNARLASATLALLFKTSVQIDLSLTVSLDGSTVKGKISNLTPTIAVTETTIGPISGIILTDIAQTAAKLFIVPQLDAIGEKGFQIPMIQKVNFISPSVTFDSHALCLSTDVGYSPN